MPLPGPRRCRLLDPVKPRLIATDLDGTLVRSDGTVSPRSVAAISGLDAVGVGFVMVTARPPRWLHDLRHLVGDHGVVICSNGAFVYDVPSQRITAEHGIDAATVCALAADLRTALPGIAFAVETRDGFGHEPGRPRCSSSCVGDPWAAECVLPLAPLHTSYGSANPTYPARFGTCGV